ncbi:MAG: hypothetical protein COB51_12260 [Moraxellaceae bacterium]|nr:MAG: hypothetical protein COB51_12260 [Moraxellaceae bacterium]
MSQLLRNLISRHQANVSLAERNIALDGINIVQPRPQSKFESLSRYETQSNLHSQSNDQAQSKYDVTLGWIDSNSHTFNTRENDFSLKEGQTNYSGADIDVNPSLSTPSIDQSLKSSSASDSNINPTPHNDATGPQNTHGTDYSKNKHSSINYPTNENLGEGLVEGLENTQQFQSRVKPDIFHDQQTASASDQFLPRVETILERLNEIRSSAIDKQSNQNRLVSGLENQLALPLPNGLAFENNKAELSQKTKFSELESHQTETTKITQGATKQDKQRILNPPHSPHNTNDLQQTHSNINRLQVNQLLEQSPKKTEKIINVSIGRVEIKAHLESTPEAARPHANPQAKPKGVMDLGDYLTLRNKERS